MSCYCCEKDENGNWLHRPCCDYGICEHSEGDKDISMCIHCGAEMFEENGFWYHHTQEEIPINERGTIHI